ncbi:MAG: hypothetical protein ACW99G_11660 [Candidatus Thorarchaeota archaeon]|jgi:hypothetical protein
MALCELCHKRESTHTVHVNEVRVCDICWEHETFDCAECHESCCYRDSSIIEGLSHCPECSASKLDDEDGNELYDHDIYFNGMNFPMIGVLQDSTGRNREVWLETYTDRYFHGEDESGKGCMFLRRSYKQNETGFHLVEIVDDSSWHFPPK